MVCSQNDGDKKKKSSNTIPVVRLSAQPASCPMSKRRRLRVSDTARCNPTSVLPRLIIPDYNHKI